MKQHITFVGLILALVLPTITAAQSTTGQRAERTRADLLRDIATASATSQRSPEDAGAQFAYAKLLYQAGEFWRARDMLTRLTESASAPDSAVELAAKLQFLTGNYDASERLYDRLIQSPVGSPMKQIMAKVGKMFAYYQRDRFSQIGALDFPAGVVLPNVTLAKSFDQPPYQLTWANERHVSEVPLYALDPLPQFSIEVNGMSIDVFFDTGGDTLLLDDEVAKRLGVTAVSSAMGSFGGGLQAKVGFGKVDRVKLGDVTIRNVPVMILPTKRWTMDPKHPLGGSVGTAFMRQFLGTLDYKNRKMIFRERSPENARAVRRTLEGKFAAEVPFILDATHLMHARGSLNGKDSLTFFIDSGLASDAAFTAPIQTLQYAGIAVPETKMAENGEGGGGGKWAQGFFPVKSLTLGPLKQTDLQGEYGSRPPESYWSLGYIADGLLSHGFLKQYASWTIDFDAMKFLFEKR